MLTHETASSGARASMYTSNRLKLGLFGANCSSGRTVTMVPERWQASWRDNVQLAQMADAAGIDFLLPIGRWKGYGGDTDYQGATFETITWATGLLAKTERIVVFGTVHAPLFPPIIAAKQMVTADHVGEGCFGLNLVCGWNEGEFEMFGVQPGDHQRRYAQGQEWIDALSAIWTRNDFDFDGEIIKLHGVRAKPKPWGETRPVILNAGSSPEGKAFAIRNCDAFFTSANPTAKRTSVEESPFEEAAGRIMEAKTQALAYGRKLGVYTASTVTLRPTQREAEDYLQYVQENTDWNAIDSIMEMKGLNDKPPEIRERIRAGYARGMGGVPLTGSPDTIAASLAQISAVGFDGIAISFTNYLDELPYFRDEVLPRLEGLGLRVPAAALST
jgi:alkanesulfonate monooxygenase SsuD/methylene tetrahydromethanopterin reductase-like flavin-dependent oxidoreductase (luciferase family)